MTNTIDRTAGDPPCVACVADRTRTAARAWDVRAGIDSDALAPAGIPVAS